MNQTQDKLEQIRGAIQVVDLFEIHNDRLRARRAILNCSEFCEPSDPPFIVPLFPFGTIVATPAALEAISTGDLVRGFLRHVAGDWGDIDDHGRRENAVSLENGFRLRSAYHTVHGLKFWIITEADRSVSTFLLPDDY
jgi:hypothetical protein